MAINKGEIVKRIMYENPDAEFVFCAGDDKVCSATASVWRDQLSNNVPVN